MKIKIFIIFAVLLCSISFSQNKKIEKQKQEVVKEGKMLYRSEMASWYGSDIFMEKFADKKSRVGGYVSYLDNEIAKCVFFSKDTKPKTLATITFDSTYNVSTAIIDETERELTNYENDLAVMRIKTFELINQNKDSIFRFYENTNFNIIPVIKENQKRVFVLTGSSENGTALIGNDYLLTFNENNSIVKTERLHNSILKFPMDKDSATGIHNHLEGKSELITSTDICTLMLYSRLSNWKSHIVITKKYVSMWNCKTSELFVMTFKAYEKIANAKERN